MSKLDVNKEKKELSFVCESCGSQHIIKFVDNEPVLTTRYKKPIEKKPVEKENKNVKTKEDIFSTLFGTDEDESGNTEDESEVE